MRNRNADCALTLSQLSKADSSSINVLGNTGCYPCELALGCVLCLRVKQTLFLFRISGRNCGSVADGLDASSELVRPVLDWHAEGLCGLRERREEEKREWRDGGRWRVLEVALHRRGNVAISVDRIDGFPDSAYVLYCPLKPQVK